MANAKLVDLSTIDQLNPKVHTPSCNYMLEGEGPQACNCEGLDLPKNWFVYFLKSTITGKSYVGMTCDVQRRLRQHNGELVGGAKYTKTGRPWELVLLYGPYSSRVEGCRVEWRAKRFRGEERFKYRLWVAELQDNAPDKDKHLHHYKGKKVKAKKVKK